MAQMRRGELVSRPFLTPQGVVFGETQVVDGHPFLDTPIALRVSWFLAPYTAERETSIHMRIDKNRVQTDRLMASRVSTHVSRWVI